MIVLSQENNLFYSSHKPHVTNRYYRQDGGLGSVWGSVLDQGYDFDACLYNNNMNVSFIFTI